MSNELADFMLSNMVRPPNARNRRQYRRMHSGASIGSSVLVIATVEAVEFRKPQLCQDETAYFLLEGRDQRSVRRQFNAIQEFVRKRHLTHLFLRGSATSGKYTAAPATYMIEGILNLVSGLHVEVVGQQYVSRWVRREGAIAPFCPPKTPRCVRDPFELAIQTACLIEARSRDPECLPHADPGATQ